jgi:hypothetical protein
MKKVSLYLVLVFVGLLSACNLTTETPTPTPTSFTVTIPSSAPSTAKIGEKVAFTVNVSAPNTLKQLEISKNNSAFDTRSGLTGTTFQYKFEYTTVTADAGRTLSFRFVAQDTKGNTQEATYTLNVGTGVNNTNDIRLLNQNAATLSSAGSFYASSTNTISNSANANTANVDITYGIVNGNPTFVSPDSRVSLDLSVGGRTGWTRTTFASSNLNFDTVTRQELSSATTPSATNVSVVQNGVYIFQNAAGKRGLLRVKSFVRNGSNTADQDVIFDIKVID